MSAVYKLKKTTLNLSHLQTVTNNILKYSPFPKKVKIIVVTKTFSFQAIKSAEEQNLFQIGESKVQETQYKLKNNKLNPKTKIHLIGRLQRNKTNKAVQTYDVIQSVDSLKLLVKINAVAKKNNKKQKIFLQTNLKGKPTQAGASNEETLFLAKKTKKLQNIKLCGIMSIGPNTQNTKKIKEYFQKIKKIQKTIEKTINPTCSSLSLGMSGDYKQALQIGATHIRLGTLLFDKSRYE
ncbi:MAG: YggS family pyridoxal phosphate-dependent enzyme [Candidatus Marinimicrobia bacterium]|nr:YggS family pyridoxal phosphate-dependent enzyme [Candidatus Neomarinimicrobiota bacterium]|tara:strand:+ start:4318 stop:5028 length:711 start_codon:yes stop_codon:yes gene_type:complete